jgi:hypothetical protein
MYKLSRSRKNYALLFDNSSVNKFYVYVLRVNVDQLEEMERQEERESG